MYVFDPLGISTTSYGLYQFYTSFTSYPSDIRTHLRAALRSASSSEYERADRSFAAAYALAQTLFDSHSPDLGSTLQEQRKRLTGIAISWGGMWEEAGEWEKAVKIYDRAWKVLLLAIEMGRERDNERGGIGLVVDGKGGEGVGGKEVMRAVQIALKMGDLITTASELAASRSTMLQEEVEEEEEGSSSLAEKYYVFAVEEMLRLSMNVRQREQVGIELLHHHQQQQHQPGSTAVTGDEEAENEKKKLQLSEEVSPLELASGLERLGEYYARRGIIE